MTLAFGCLLVGLLALGRSVWERRREQASRREAASVLREVQARIDADADEDEDDILGMLRERGHEVP